MNSSEYNKNDYSEKRGYQNCVPYEVLDSAISGDKNAIYEIVTHFGGYMIKSLMNEKVKANETFRFIKGRLEPDDEDFIEMAKIDLIQSLSKFKKKY